MTTIRLNVFGRLVEVLHQDNNWQVFYLSNEGKKRPATDILIPANLGEAQVQEYIADLCHEWATPKQNAVTRLD